MRWNKGVSGISGYLFIFAPEFIQNSRVSFGYSLTISLAEAHTDVAVHNEKIAAKISGCGLLKHRADKLPGRQSKEDRLLVLPYLFRDLYFQIITSISNNKCVSR